MLQVIFMQKQRPVPFTKKWRKLTVEYKYLLDAELTVPFTGSKGRADFTVYLTPENKE